MIRSTGDRPHGDWWRTAVIYEIYIRSFADADGDGVGDIAGIRSRLPYLAELGVDAIWITPWYCSPMADGGYDVADHCDIAPEFGDLRQAESLIDEAHGRGIRVILDLVPNHTSDRHPWFQRATAANPGATERDLYWFRPGRGPGGAEPPNDWRSVFGGSAWSRLASDGPEPEWVSPPVRPRAARPQLDASRRRRRVRRDHPLLVRSRRRRTSRRRRAWTGEAPPAP